MDDIKVTSRAMNPLSADDDPSETFCDQSQARATTATQLFRCNEMLAAFKEIVIPKYFENRIRRGLDVWSAGCSSGEEAYSLAVVGNIELQKRKELSKCTVYGTDISVEQLKKAKRGRYLLASSSATIAPHIKDLNKFACIQDGVIQMLPVIRERVKFGKFDLRRRPRKHVFDFIVCNHVFQYYDTSSQLNFVNNFLAVLKPGGVVFIEGLTAEAERKSQLVAVDGYQKLFALAQ